MNQYNKLHSCRQRIKHNWINCTNVARTKNKTCHTTNFYSHTHTPTLLHKTRSLHNTSHSNTTPTHPTRKQIASRFHLNINTMLRPLSFICSCLSCLVQLLTWLLDYHNFWNFEKQLSKNQEFTLKQLFQLQKHFAKWRQRFGKSGSKKVGFFVKKLKFLQISDNTIWFQFHQHVVQIRIK